MKAMVARVCDFDTRTIDTVVKLICQLRKVAEADTE